MARKGLQAYFCQKIVGTAWPKRSLLIFFMLKGIQGSDLPIHI